MHDHACPTLPHFFPQCNPIPTLSPTRPTRSPPIRPIARPQWETSPRRGAGAGARALAGRRNGRLVAGSGPAPSGACATLVRGVVALGPGVLLLGRVGGAGGRGGPCRRAGATRGRGGVCRRAGGAGGRGGVCRRVGGARGGTPRGTGPILCGLTGMHNLLRRASQADRVDLCTTDMRYASRPSAPARIVVLCMSAAPVAGQWTPRLRPAGADADVCPESGGAPRRPWPGDR